MYTQDIYLQFAVLSSLVCLSLLLPPPIKDIHNIKLSITIYVLTICRGLVTAFFSCVSSSSLCEVQTLQHSSYAIQGVRVHAYGSYVKIRMYNV